MNINSFTAGHTHLNFKESRSHLSHTVSAEFIAQNLGGKKTAKGWMCRCPAHNDHNPSLSISEVDGKILFRCMARCPQEAVLEALRTRNLWPSIGMASGVARNLTTEYIYRSLDGLPALKVTRIDPASGPKKIFQSFRDESDEWIRGGFKGELLPYRFEIWGNKLNRKLFLCEGEKAADSIIQRNMLATTTPGGSQAWKSHYAKHFKDREVIIIPDNDDPGRKYAAHAYHDIKKFAKAVDILELPGLNEKEDAFDFFASGRSSEDFQTLVKDLPSMSDSMKLILEVTMANPVTLVTEVQTIDTNIEDNEHAVEEPVIHGGQWDVPITFESAGFKKFPIEAFPPTIQKFAVALAESTETPIELPGLMLLSVLSTCFAKAFEVVVKQGYSEPLTLWTCCALESGNRKTQVLKNCVAPIYEWQTRKWSAMGSKIKSIESEVKSRKTIIEGRRKKLSAEMNSTEQDIEMQAIARLEADLPEIPKLPILVGNDITPEKLGVVLQDNGERFSILSDEGGIFDLLGGRYSKGVPNLDLFLKSHSGSPDRTDRSGRESVNLESPSLAIGICPQPSVIKALVLAPSFRGRGLLARFLYCLPKSLLGKRTLMGQPVAEETRLNYESHISRCLDLVFDSEGRKLKPTKKILLSKEALDLWLDFGKELEPKLAENSKFGSLQDWTSKLPGAIARIAANFHCSENAHGDPSASAISSTTMLNAIDLGDALSEMALETFSFMEADPAIENAKRILKWIEENRLSEFSQRDCLHKFQRRFKDLKSLRECLDVLEERHFIRLINKNERRSVQIIVNPKFLETV